MAAHTEGWALPIARILRGQIWRVAFDPVRGREQAKTRPAVIVQRDSANRVSPTTIVCPIADARNRLGNLLNVPVKKGEGGTTRDSLVVCNQVRTIDRERLVGRALGELDEQTMQLVDAGLRAILDL